MSSAVYPKVRWTETVPASSRVRTGAAMRGVFAGAPSDGATAATGNGVGAGRASSGSGTTSSVIRPSASHWAYGLAAATSAFKFVVAQNDAALGVDQDHLAGSKATLLDDGRLIDGDGARFRSGDKQTVGGDRVA